MRIARKKLKKLCTQNGLTLNQLLKDAEVSKNAYYSLARKDTVLPRSVMAIADHLGVRPSAFLEERPKEDRWKILLEDLERISTRNPDADRDNIRHTLLLLEEPPIERLRRALTRGQKLDLHGRRG
jgi:transcriptional regulator with XRE-family HTH domain